MCVRGAKLGPDGAQRAVEFGVSPHSSRRCVFEMKLHSAELEWSPGSVSLCEAQTSQCGKPMANRSAGATYAAQLAPALRSAETSTRWTS
jgi:hypothetical protein